MIFTTVVAIAEATCDEEKYIPILTDAEVKRAERIKDEKTRKESLCAHALLHILYKDTFSADIDELCYTEDGKPYAEGGHAVGISHTGGTCVVCVSTDGEIGIDAEKEMSDARRAKNIEERFLSRLESISLLPYDTDIRFFEYDLVCGGYREIFPEPAEPACFGARWTTLEAILKKDGRGFGAFPPHGNFRAVSFKAGDLYISVAK